MSRVVKGILVAPLVLGALAGCAASEPADESGEGFGAGTASFLAEPVEPVPEAPGVGGVLDPVLGRDPALTQLPPLAGADAAAVPAVANPAPERQTTPANVPGAPAGGAVPQRDALRQHERDLRERLRGSERVEAALDLAALLTDLERHAEALTMLESVRSKTADPSLTVAVAGVQRDLGRRHVAVRELRELRQLAGALALHPGLLFELAELEWLEGDREAAMQTIVELRRAHADNPWLRDNDKRLTGLAEEIASAKAPRRVAVLDLLGNLRGAPSPTVRMTTLEQLVTMTRRPDASPDVRRLERRILSIGVGDSSAAVRARAIQLGPHATSDKNAFFDLALADSDALVRRVAAVRAAELMGTAAAPLLLARLAVETDVPTFVALDAELLVLAGDPRPASTLVLPDEAQRERIRAGWQRRREELGW